MAKKSGEKKVTKKTQEKYDTILNAMQPDIWYKASEFETVAGVKESRIKVLLLLKHCEDLIVGFLIFWHFLKLFIAKPVKAGECG